jgi:hypothetical protein
MALNTTTGSGGAYVVPDAYGFQVVPPVVTLSPGSTFTLRNLTHSSVHASFPAGLMSPSEGDIEPQGTAEFTVLSTASKGVYEYSVTVVLVAEDVERGIRAVTLQAKGGSDPRIIIDF